MARYGHMLHRGVPASSLASEFGSGPIRLDLEWLVAVWIPIGRDGTRVLEVRQDGTHVLGSGEMEPAPKGSGETEPAALGSGETF